MPDLSVVIPTYNGAARLFRSLDSLSKQTLPANRYETIIVVDGSTDNTVDILAKWSTPFRLVLIEQPNQGAGAARNAGVAVAQGTYCVFLDDDIIAHPQLLEEHLRVQGSHSGVVGLGSIPTVVPAGAGWLARSFAEYANEHRGKLARGTRPPGWRDCYSGNMSVARDAFLEAGGFAADMRRGEDVELGYRLAQQGLSFIFISGAVGTEEQRKGTRELMSDFEANAMAAADIYRRHPATLPSVIPNFNAPGTGPVWLRRLLLAMDAPPRLLPGVGLLLRKKTSLRTWYSFIHSYCGWRGLRRGLADLDSWWQLTHSTPILSYGALSAGDERGKPHPVAIRRFARHVTWLKRANYRVLSLEEYCQYQREHRVPPNRSVVITLDDEHRDAYSSADRLLVRYGYPTAARLAAGLSSEDPSSAHERDNGERRLGSGVNNHRTPPHELYRTPIDTNDSLVRFAWKVWRASSGAPRQRVPGSLLRIVRRRLPQVIR